MIDLHLHSYYSDGVYSPSELAKKMKLAGFSVVSLTDHNGLDGVKEFLKQGGKIGLKVIPGVEIYTRFRDKHLHLLGYGFDLEDKKLNSVLKGLQKQRIPRIKKAIEILQNEGWEMREKEIFETNASYLGLVHLANFLKKSPRNWARIKKDFDWFPGKIIPITEIIAKYFIKNSHSIYGGHSICPETTIPVDQAIALLKQAGGKTILAHPGVSLSWKDNALIVDLKNMGLDGIEAISSHHSWQQIEHWQIIAKESGLIITAGSDFHGILPQEWGLSINSQWDYFKVLKNTEIEPL